LVNNLRDKPMTQFSFEWILSLNSPSQFWGPLHSEAATPSKLVLAPLKSPSKRYKPESLGGTFRFQRRIGSKFPSFVLSGLSASCHSAAHHSNALPNLAGAGGQIYVEDIVYAALIHDLGTFRQTGRWSDDAERCSF
jgi:hypothetical protein